MGIWYNGGSIAVENGSASIVGTTTLFNTKVKVGDTLLTLQSDTLRLNQVTVITDDNNATIDPVWAGDTASDLVYYVIPTSPDWGEVSEVAHDLANFLANVATFFPTDGQPDDDEGGPGSFAIDANASPPLLYFKAADTWDDGTIMAGPMGATGLGYGGTSTDSKTLAASGSMSFTTQSGLAWQAGNRLRVASQGAVTTKWMEGVISSYSGTTLIITIDKQGSGSGSASDWTFGPAGIPGEKGDTGSTGSKGDTGNTGATGLGYGGTSTTSRLIASSGTMTWSIGAGKAYQAGDLVKIVATADATQWMKGNVSSYSSGVLTVEISEKSGSGTFASWNIGLAGETGPQGAKGDKGDTGATGTDGTNGTNGTDGTNFDPDARGLLADRDAHDDEATGFSYLSIDGDGDAITTAVLFFKLSASSADWSGPTTFQGPQGETGATGEKGDKGDQGPTGITGPQGDPGAIDGDFYDDTTEGIAATSDGDYFLVPGDDVFLWASLYRNDSGVATFISSYASRTYTDRVLLSEDVGRIAAQRGWRTLPTAGEIAYPDLPPRGFAVSRASIATRCNAVGYIETLSADELQHDYDPMTGAYLGWLLEPSRTNLLTYSDDFTNAYWTKARVTITANAATSATGETDACFMEETTDSGAHAVTRAFTVVAGQDYAIAWDVKGVGRDRAWIVADGVAIGETISQARFELVDDGDATVVTNCKNLKITRYRDDWYRIESTVTPETSGSMRFYLATGKSDDSDSAFVGETGKGLYVKFAQFEVGSRATSRIPTNGATVTRAVTSIIKSIGAASEGTIFVSAKTIGTAETTERLLSAYVNTNNRAQLSRNASTPLYAGYVFDSSVGIFGPSPSPANGDQIYAAFTWKAGAQSIGVNGVVTDAGSPLSSPPIGSMDLVVGSAHGSSEAAFMHVTECFFFPRFMTSETLEAATSPNFFSVNRAHTRAERTAWTGAVTSSGFSAFSDFDLDDNVALVVSQNSRMTSPVFTSSDAVINSTSGTSKTYNSCIVEATGLDPNTEYWWCFKQNGRYIGLPRKLRTAPEDGTATSFTFAPVACSAVNAATVDNIFASIVQDKPAFLLHMGDLVYDNVDTDNIALKRDKFVRQYLAGPSASYLHRTLPVVYTPDNHDCYGPWVGLDYPNFETVMENMRRVYRETVPHYPFEQERLGEDDGDVDKVILAQRWTWGRVRFLMPDVNAQRDNVNGKILGDIYWDQKQWLFDQLDEADADANIALIVIVSGETWIGRDPNDADDPANLDSWDDDRFKADQTALCDKIETLGTMVTLLCGDGHQGGADDGTYGDRSTSGHARFANFMSSGLKQPANASSIWGVGPFQWNGSDGSVMYVNIDMTLYAIMSIDDNGGDDLSFSMTFKGNPVNPITKVPTTKLTVASDDVTPAISFADATAAGSVSSTVSLDVDKSWFGPVGGCSATWTASHGPTGTVAFNPNSNRSVISVETPTSVGEFTIELFDPVRAELGSVDSCTVTVS